ncbi:hypothetical protein LCI18_006997 [Fusarium solani-melongenae]|uniref:Uncharacterized protein n=1 Tax=Fusarium solani subsp. cucurbitae TaxID=2747967 RepID=A0ACD3Z4C0_FUSSC|nr:hypothetical protein LCI18_006997 [Fusarium solani-melongenae]
MDTPNRLATPSRARKSPRRPFGMKNVALALLFTAPVVVSAQDCISLKDSKACPAFESASISTNATLIEFFPFLQYVSDRASFDNQLSSYVKTAYVQGKYQSLFGCGNVDLQDPSDMYARFTTTVLCNAIVQNSIGACGLTEDQSRPLCADSCAEFAQSEAYVTSDDDLCSNPSTDLLKLIRADFTNCALPNGSLDSSKCISGIENESQNCGYGNSTVGLCSYCGSGGLNSTDTCCYNSGAEERCKDVKLPALTATLTFSRTLPSATSTSTTAAGNDNKDDEKTDDDDDSGLSGGAIAGIVIGVLAGVALLALGIFFCLRRRRRPSSPKGSIFNQPSPARQGGTMTQTAPPTVTHSAAPQGYEVLPGGRIARMSALEGHSGDSPSHHRDDSSNIGGTAGYRRRGADNSSSASDGFGDSPASDIRAGILRPPPAKPRRNGSLSSSSALGSSVPQSPTSAGGFSSPQAMTSQQSEQLPFFKDYYSQDDVHPGDRVAVLWAYQPRATDEFSLDRGDMLKVVGIWDDGWATGVMLNERADEWEARRQAQRDSGVSNTSGRRDSSPVAEGEIKAFPLVCVCLPEHWRKTIEGDGSTESGSNGFNTHSPLS